MRSKNFISFIKGILLIQVFVAAIIAGLTVDIQGFSIGDFRGNQTGYLIAALGPDLNSDQASMLVRETNVMMGAMGQNDSENSSYVQGTNPQKMLSEHIQVLAFAAPVPVPLEKDPMPAEIELPAVVAGQLEKTEQVFLNDNENQNAEVFQDQKAYFYCTHSAESYIPNSGKAKLEGDRGLVNTVAQTLAEECSKRGMSGIFIDKIHDFPEYNKSYTMSRETVSDICAKDPKAIGLFDVHRDSIPGTKTAPRVTIDGKSSAQILIVVGSDERKPHPHWQKNYLFANRLYRQAEKQYPGLIRGVRKKSGTYNQEYNTHALLLEFGSDYNTLDEAKYAAQLFSEVLVEVLKEEKQTS
ncbi:MAG: stage II sporulation protein P [Bacillota bacterium]|nr:stage II sporulation protein P [Bacillota bacterium]